MRFCASLIVLKILGFAITSKATIQSLVKEQAAVNEEAVNAKSDEANCWYNNFMHRHCWHFAWVMVSNNLLQS